jgi:hypothetical protein
MPLKGFLLKKIHDFACKKFCHGFRQGKGAFYKGEVSSETVVLVILEEH